MGKSNRALTLALASCLATTLTACGGSDSSSPTPLSTASTTTTTETTTTEAGSTTTTTTSTIAIDTGRIGPNTAHSIVFSTPFSDSLENMSNGFYRRTHSAMVTDLEGHAVADGTPVYLKAIDSIMAKGTINATNASIAGSVLTDTSRLGTDDISNIYFDSAYVIRNDSHHFIHEGSHLLLTKNSHAEDRIRTISSTALQNQAITVNSNYTTAYPHTHPLIPDSYDESEYVIGESLIGIEVGGLDAEGKHVTGLAYTNEGIATFYVTYPANTQTALVGCTDPTIDDRYPPTGSAQPYIFAYVSDSVSAVKTACFNIIAGGELVAIPGKRPSSGPITVSFRDGGDKFRVPFIPVFAYVELDDALADITIDIPASGYYTTDKNGLLTATVTVTAGKGKVVFTAGEVEVSVTVGS